MPDAQVLAIRIMSQRRRGPRGDLIYALGLMAVRVANALNGDMAQMVDVISLSLGYFDESPADPVYTSGLWLVIQPLLAWVCRSSPRPGTTRPAAASTRPRSAVPSPGPGPADQRRRAQPERLQALFSDGGRWVRAWAAGAAMVSTFPVTSTAAAPR